MYARCCCLHSLLSACIRSRQTTYHPYEISLFCIVPGLKRSHKIHMSIEKWKIYRMCAHRVPIQCKHQLVKENQTSRTHIHSLGSLSLSQPPHLPPSQLTTWLRRVCILKTYFQEYYLLQPVKLCKNCPYVRWKKYCKAQRHG